MARVDVIDESVGLDEPMLVEGLPGLGLVGKIAADHLVDAFEMAHVANLLCESLPPVAVYGEGERGVSPPVRVYADAERDLLVLQSDVPVTPASAREFAGCLGDWQADVGATPIYLSGRPAEKDENPPELYGVSTGEAGSLLAAADVPEPNEDGLVSGPTGALLHHAFAEDVDAVGLIVESDPQFPDPEAARVLISDGIEPLTGIEVPTENLVEKAEEIREAKEQLAQQLRDAEGESTQARPLRGYQ
ncbi:MAG: proteasome assembly chaperone family protein [Haloferacaceae archaeon]